MDGSIVCNNEARTKVQEIFDVLVKRIQELEAERDEKQATILQLETAVFVLTRQLHACAKGLEQDSFGQRISAQQPQTRRRELEQARKLVDLEQARQQINALHQDREKEKLAEKERLADFLSAREFQIDKPMACSPLAEEDKHGRERGSDVASNRAVRRDLLSDNCNPFVALRSPRTIDIERATSPSRSSAAMLASFTPTLPKCEMNINVLGGGDSVLRKGPGNDVVLKSDEKSSGAQRANPAPTAQFADLPHAPHPQYSSKFSDSTKTGVQALHAKQDDTSDPKVDSSWLNAQDAMRVGQLQELSRRKGIQTRDRLPWGCLSEGIPSPVPFTQSQATVDDVDVESARDALDKALSHWGGLASHCMTSEQVFDEMDTNNDKVLSLSEVTHALQKMKLTDLGEEEIAAIFRDLGGAGDTGVNLMAFEYRLQYHREQRRLIDLLQGRINFTALIAELVLPKFSADQVFGARKRNHDLAPVSIASLSQLSEMKLQRRLAPFLKEVVTHVREVSRTVEQCAHQRAKASVGGHFDVGKFSMPVRQAQFGNLEMFHRGLNALIGLPAIDLLGAMQLEHDDEAEFSTSNYHLNTSPLLEWEFVVNPDPSRTYPGEKGPGNIHGRVRKLLGHLMLERECKAAGLTEEEIIALRLYTGPMFQHYNKVLRECLRRHVLRYAKMLVERWKIRLTHQSGEAAGITRTKSRDDYVSLEELVDAASRLGVDRNGSAAEVAERLLIAVRDLKNTTWKPGFTTTIHMINSGIIKLEQLMRLPKSRTVYRGLGGTALPNCFFWPDEFGCRGGTEAAFMSTTLDSDIALQYISDLSLPLVFELSVGQVDRGAEVKWCSQYPNENEILFPPLCNLEVIGNPAIKLFGSGDNVKEVLVFTCKLSVNFKSMSREELESRRYTQLVSSLSYSYQEIERDLNRQMQIVFQKNPHKAEEGEQIVQKILEECEELIAYHRSTNPKNYNESEGFHQMALQDCALLPSMALAKFSAWYDRGLCYPSNFSELSMHEWQIFFQGEQWKAYENQWKSMKTICNNKEQGTENRYFVTRELQEVALPLIKSRGLLFSRKEKTVSFTAQFDCSSNSIESRDNEAAGAFRELDGFRNGLTALMLAVFKGDPFDVELLLSAGCTVDAEDKAGRTALMCSIILGEHKQQIEIAHKLIQYGARLDSTTGTLLHTAARCGRAIHTEMLLEAAAQRGGGEEACHAYASITSTNTGHTSGASPLLLAAQCGHTNVFELLAQRFPHLIPLSKNDGMTALDMAAWNNRVEIARILLDKGGEELMMHQDDKGWTCLSRAVDQGHQDMIKMILQASDRTYAEKLLMLRDKDGLTSIDLAQKKWGIDSSIPNPAVLQLLNGGWRVVGALSSREQEYSYSAVDLASRLPGARKAGCWQEAGFSGAVAMSVLPEIKIPLSQAGIESQAGMSWLGGPQEAGTEAPRVRVCGYLTDVEGNLDFFERYLGISKILDWVDTEKTRLRFKRDDAMFVYGGDTQDKGIGDIRFTKLLLALKQEHPDRVQLIIGNRDANKLRLAAELHADCIDDARVRTDAEFPYWVEAGKRVTPQMFLECNPPANGGASNTAANRLRWILKETMGADGAFGRRREELAMLRQTAVDAVSEEDVVESYRNEVDPQSEGDSSSADNFVLNYLQQGKLAYVFGSTLFVHGAISESNMGTVPGKREPVQQVHDWVRELNSWGAQELINFAADPYSGNNRRDRKGGGLMDYGVPEGNGGASVVYEHFLSNGSATQLPPRVHDYLVASGITGVVAGHQPHGDCPCVTRSGLVTVITADTSYSQMGHMSAWGADNRGEKAVSEVLVYADGSMEVHGVLADGSNIAYTLAADGRGDRFVGRQLSNGYWVKARTVGDNNEYVLCIGEGFKMTVLRKKESEMEALSDADFMQPVGPVSTASCRPSKQASTGAAVAEAAAASPLLRKKISSEIDALALLHRSHPWVPGAENIRPTQKTRQVKQKTLESIGKDYAGESDFLLEQVFDIDLTREADGKLHAGRDCASKLVKAGRVLKPNVFPYDLPHGTRHWVMWYPVCFNLDVLGPIGADLTSWLRAEPSDDAISADIEQELRRELEHELFDFVWYLNPKQSVPNIFHVQVFWISWE